MLASILSIEFPLPVNGKPQVLQNFEKWFSLTPIFNRQIYIDI